MKKAIIRLAEYTGVAILALVAASLIAWGDNWRANQIKAQQTTPEQCQYPTRPLVNGQCDNSDPCDPTTLKDPVLHGDCAPASKTDTTSAPLEPSKPEATSTPAMGCGK